MGRLGAHAKKAVARQPGQLDEPEVARAAAWLALCGPACALKIGMEQAVMISAQAASVLLQHL